MRWIFPAVLLLALSSPSISAQQTVEIPPGRTVLAAKGVGVQIYTCTAQLNGVKWVLKGPDARLLDAEGQQIGTHFAGPTWKLNDGSQVIGELLSSRPSPDARSVAWLLLQAKTGSATGKLADVKFIRRSETRGGMPPASGCDTAGDAGKVVQSPYSATYTFFAAR